MNGRSVTIEASSDPQTWHLISETSSSGDYLPIPLDRVSDLGQLQALLGEDRIGTEVTAKVVRAGEVRELRPTVGAK